MGKSYYIGIDGGATKTIVCLADELGDILEILKLEGSNYHTVGIEKVKSILGGAIEKLSEDHEIAYSEIKGICFGGAGIDSDEGAEIITNVFRDIGYKNDLRVCNDGLIALVGANGDYKGGVVIGGTGSVALGLDDDMKLHKVGGWGHILDDKGSGYAIGKSVLSKIMEAYDGRGEETLLWEKIKEHLEISNPEEITDFVYSDKTKKHHIAQIAPIVVELYDEDKVAKGIIKEAIADLEKLIITLAKNIEKESFSLGLYGSLLVKNEKIRNGLIEKVHSIYPKIDLHLPYGDAHLGALDIAMGKVKID